MLNPTSPRLRWTRKLIISLILFSASSLICMEGNSCKKNKSLEIVGLLSLPCELNLCILDFSILANKTDDELSQTIRSLPRINKYFYQLLLGDLSKSIWLNGLILLEKIKNIFYALHNLNYPTCKISLDKDLSLADIKYTVISNLNKFSKNKDNNVKQLKLGAKEQALMTGILQNNKELTLLALKNGANPNYKTDTEITALMLAAREGKKELVELLLENGANVNLGNNINATPLMFSASNGHMDTVKILLQKGANPMAQNLLGESASEVARQKDFPDIADLLEKAIQHGLIRNSDNNNS